MTKKKVDADFKAGTTFDSHLCYCRGVLDRSGNMGQDHALSDKQDWGEQLTASECAHM